MKQSFIKELMSIFKTKTYMQRKKEMQLIDYFKIVESNILYTFQKIKKEYERD